MLQMFLSLTEMLSSSQICHQHQNVLDVKGCLAQLVHAAEDIPHPRVEAAYMAHPITLHDLGKSACRILQLEVYGLASVSTEQGESRF